MTWWHALLVAAGVSALIYLAFIGWLVLAGRRTDARALAGFIPDCIVLFRRLLADQRVPRSRKLLLAALIGYLAMPFDLVPDFIPVAGQLDDAIIVALVLRTILRSAGADLLREHWPGPDSSLNTLARLARTAHPQLKPRAPWHGIVVATRLLTRATARQDQPLCRTPGEFVLPQVHGPTNEHEITPPRPADSSL